MWANAILPALALLVQASSFLAQSPAGYQCKCGPGDACWPTAANWAELNATVDGLLQAVVPYGAVCYQSGFEGASTFDEAKCDNAVKNWLNETWLTDQNVGLLWPLWTNVTCNPAEVGSPPNTPPTCSLGFLPPYVIMAQTAAHIQAGVKFAKKYNIRLVIRNTGHDFLGRSTGWGSLAINTHSFKNIEFIKKYEGPSDDKWSGSAVKIGAGVQARELYKKAFAQNPKVVVVGGECPTVGLAGGYIQGGGHSPLGSIHGMAADNVLAWEVITADGNLVTANSAVWPDLYWALKGGGPSTFGVVLSVTLKTFPELRSSAATLDVKTTTNSTLFWKAVSAVHSRANDFVDKGMFVYFEMFPGPTLHVQPFLGPGMTKAQIDAAIKPVLDDLKAAGIPFNSTSEEFPTWFELYTKVFEDERPGDVALVGGRIFTHEDVAKNNTAIVEGYRMVVEGLAGTAPGPVFGHIVGPGVANPTVDNPLHPAWRKASSFSVISIPAETSFGNKTAVQNILTNVIQKAWREAGPLGAAYINEGDIEETDWQTSFWGSNYPRLKELKKSWDPQGVFFARSTPGTEDWEVIDYGRRLCKKTTA